MTYPVPKVPRPGAEATMLSAEQMQGWIVALVHAGDSEFLLWLCEGWIESNQTASRCFQLDHEGLVEEMHAMQERYTEILEARKPRWSYPTDDGFEPLMPDPDSPLVRQIGYEKARDEVDRLHSALRELSR